MLRSTDTHFFFVFLCHQDLASLEKLSGVKLPYVGTPFISVECYSWVGPLTTLADREVDSLKLYTHSVLSPSYPVSTMAFDNNYNDYNVWIDT